MNDGQGFTLVELVTLIAVLGILAAVAAPRFFDGGAFAGRGFFDQAAAFLRYAQKQAVARHDEVFVQLNGNALTLCQASGIPCAAGVPGPDGA